MNYLSTKRLRAAAAASLVQLQLIDPAIAMRIHRLLLGLTTAPAGSIPEALRLEAEAILQEAADA